MTQFLNQVNKATLPTGPTQVSYQLVLKRTPYPLSQHPTVSGLPGVEQIPQSTSFSMSQSNFQQPRSIAGLSSPELKKLVDEFDAFAFSGCQCIFEGDCLVCRALAFQYNLVDTPHDCQVCALSYLRVTSSPKLSVDEAFNLVAEVRRPILTFEEVMSRLCELNLKVVLNGPNSFDMTLWSDGLFDSYSRDDLESELHRPNCRPGFTGLQYLDCLFYEFVQRVPKADVLRYAYNFYKASRRRILWSPAHRARSSGAKRATSRSQPRVFVPRPSPLRRSTAVLRTQTPVPLPTLTDFVFPSEPPLYLGSYVIASRAELLSPQVERVFSRNKPLFRSIVESTGPLSSWQAMIYQKVESDSNFRHRIDGLIRAAPTVAPLESPPTPTNSLDDMFEEIANAFQSARDSGYSLDSEEEDDRIRRLQMHLAGRYDAGPCFDLLPTAINGLEFTNMLARLAVTVDLVLAAPDFSSRVKIIYLYASSLGVMGLVDCLQAFTASPVFQSGPLETAFEETLSLLGVANIFTLITGTPTSAFSFLHERFVSLARRSDGDTLVSKFWDALKALLRSFAECFRLGSVDPLFAEGDTPSEILFEAEALLIYRNEICGLTHEAKKETIVALHKKKAIPSYWTRTFLGDEYVERLRVVVGKLDACLPLVSQATRPLFVSARSRLFTFITSNVNALSVNGQRIQPLGVAVVGKAGGGKSNLIRTIIRAVASDQGFANDASSTYFWRTGVNFQDSLSPEHWVYVADDVDHNCKNAAPGVQNHVDVIMEIVDNKPLPIESANVTEKGNNYGRPLLFLYGSNNVNLRVAGFSPHFSAIYRRLPVKLTVRPSPLFSAGNMLDPSKINGEIDIHDIDIEIYDRLADDYVMFKAGATTTEALRYIKERFANNVTTQTHMLSDTQEADCQVCRIPVKVGASLCSQCAPRLQGGNVSRPLDDLTVSAANVRSMTEKAVESRLVDKMDRVFTGLDRAVGAPRSAAASLASSASSLADFFASHAFLAPAASAVAAALTVYLMSGLSFQGRVNNSTQVAPIDYTRVSEVKPLGLAFKTATWTREEVFSRVTSCIGTVVNGDQRAHVLRVGLDLFAANHHMALGPLAVVTYRGLSYDVKLSADTVVRIGTKDLILFKIPGVPAQPTALPYFWQDQDHSYSTFDSVHLLRPDGAVAATRNAIRHETMDQYSGFVVSSDIPTVEGDCGLPVIAQSGSHYRIVGLHHSQARVLTMTGLTLQARAPILTKGELLLAAPQVHGFLQSAALMKTCFPRGLEQTDLPPATSSELALALERGAGVVNLGHDRGSVGFSSSKSKCQNSPLYSDLEPYCRDLMGSPNYWQVPVLKGRMVDGQWCSGYQNIFAGYDNSENYRAFYAPILDYLAPVAHLDTIGYEMLSLDEAIRGVESSLIGPCNLRTSVGPPIGGPKSKHILHTGHISPEIVAQVTEIYNLLENGVVPIPLCSLSYKDEPVKASKNEKRDIRTICCLPAAYNLVLKQYTAPIKAFFRHNPMVMESMVGINMSLDGGQRIMERFSIINPALDNIVMGDYRKMDKMINGTCAWAAVEVFGAIAAVLGLDEMRVKLLVWSQFNVVYSIQGDLYQVGGANPSGCDMTVELNAVVNSLCQRAAWMELKGYSLSLNEYNARVALDIDFRSHNSLVTYGDDFLTAHRERHDLVRLYENFSHYGHTVTDGGAKKGDPVYRSFFEVDFLKRRFFKVDGFIRSGLLEPSILRMLMVLKPSKLSVKEQTAICCEEALREVFLNSSLDFDAWLARLRSLADKHGLRDSAYLLLADKEVYERMWQERTFTTWVTEKSE